jgi:hypothetical protein
MGMTLAAVTNNGNSFACQGRRVCVPVIEYRCQIFSLEVEIESAS